jgi:hypothetical protein
MTLDEMMKRIEDGSLEALEEKILKDATDFARKVTEDSQAAGVTEPSFLISIALIYHGCEEASKESPLSGLKFLAAKLSAKALLKVVGRGK